MAEEKILITVEFDSAALVKKLKEARTALDTFTKTLNQLESAAKKAGTEIKGTAENITKLKAAINTAQKQVKTYETQLAALTEVTGESGKQTQELAEETQAEAAAMQQAGQSAEEQGSQYNDLAARAAAVRTRLAELKDANAAIGVAAREAGGYTAEQSERLAANADETKALQKELKSLDAQMVESARSEEERTGSLNEMSQELYRLQNQYRALSETERNAAEGQELQQHIRELSDELKANEAALGDYRRNVGNYQSAVVGMVPGLNQVNSILKTLGTDISTLASGGVTSFAQLGKAATAFGKVFITPPLIVIATVVGAITLAVKGVTDAIKRNDEAGTALQVAYEALRPVINLVKQAFDLLAKGVVAVVTAFSQGLSAVMSIIPGYKQAAQAAQELVTATDALQEAERQYAKEAATREAEIQRLRNESRDEEAYSLEERKSMLEEALDLERQNTEGQRALMEERLRIRRSEIEQEQGLLKEVKRLQKQGYDEEAALVEARRLLWSRLDDTRKDEITKMEADIISLDAQFEQSTRRVQTQINTLTKEAASAAASARAELEKEAERIGALNTAILDEYRSALIGTLKDAALQAEAEENASWEKRRAALEEQLKEREKLSADAEAALWDMLRIEEEEHLQKIQDIRDAADEKAFARAQAAEEKRLELELAKAEEGSAAARDIKLEQLELTYSEQLKRTDLNEQERANLEEEWAQKRAAAQAEYAEAQGKEFAKQFEAGLEKAAGNGLGAMVEELEKVRETYGDEIQRITELTDEEIREQFGEMKAYTDYLETISEGLGDVTEAFNETMALRMEVTRETILGTAQAGVDILNSLSSIVAEDSAAYKAMAIAQAAISTGIAIANVTAKAAEAGWPAMIAIIAGGIATVTANIATAINTINSAQSTEAETYSLETGGVIGGTSYTGDRITAHVNSGEMVLNRKQQNAALAAMTGIRKTGDIGKTDQWLLWQLVNDGQAGGGASEAGRYSGGGIVSGVEYTGTSVNMVMDIGALRDALAGAVQELPAPVMDYKEFTRFSDRVVKNREYGKL